MPCHSVLAGSRLDSSCSVLDDLRGPSSGQSQFKQSERREVRQIAESTQQLKLFVAICDFHSVLANRCNVARLVSSSRFSVSFRHALQARSDCQTRASDCCSCLQSCVLCQQVREGLGEVLRDNAQGAHEPHNLLRLPSRGDTTGNGNAIGIRMCQLLRVLVISLSLSQGCNTSLKQVQKKRTSSRYKRKYPLYPLKRVEG